MSFSGPHSAQGETTKLVVAYSSPAATFCPGWIAKREGIFAKYNLERRDGVDAGALDLFADAVGGLPFPWQSGIEGMITGFHERFNPQGIKNRDARPYLDPSFVQKAAERLKLDKSRQ